MAVMLVLECFVIETWPIGGPLQTGRRMDTRHIGLCGWNGSQGAYFPAFDCILALRQLLPTAVTPAFVPMRPNAPIDPMVEFVEERADVGTLVILTPSPQDRVQLLDQIFGLQGYTTPGKLAHPIIEALDRFLSGI